MSHFYVVLREATPRKGFLGKVSFRLDSNRFLKPVNFINPQTFRKPVVQRCSLKKQFLDILKEKIFRQAFFLNFAKFCKTSIL